MQKLWRQRQRSTLHRYPRMLTARWDLVSLISTRRRLFYMNDLILILLTLSLSLPLLLSSLLINQEIKLSTLFLNYLFSHGCATFALWFPSSALYNWLLLFLKGEHVPIRLHPLSSQQGNPLRALFNTVSFFVNLRRILISYSMVGGTPVSDWHAQL